MTRSAIDQRYSVQPCSSGLDLRLEQREDHAAVRRLHLAAFGDHGHMVADLVDELSQSVTPVDGLSLVAADAGQVLGHVLFTRSMLGADAAPLRRAAARLAYAGRGVGPRDGDAALELVTALVALAAAVADWRQQQGRTHRHPRSGTPKISCKPGSGR